MKPTFTRRLVQYAEVALLVLLIQYPFYRLFKAAHLSLFPSAEAREALKFGRLPDRNIVLPSSKFAQDARGYWQAPKEPAYKNERLRAYQDLLRQRGVTNRDHLKLFTAQLLAENGALAEDVLGDWQCFAKGRGTLKGAHCSFGIPQYNTWAKHGMSAEAFLQKNPQWKDWRYQLAWMADSMAGTYKSYRNSVFPAVVSHNCPSCARARVDACFVKGKRLKRCYYQKIEARAYSLTLL